MSGKKGSTQIQLNASAIRALRDQRVDAVCRARPLESRRHIVDMVNAWYRGKPGTAPIGRIIEAAGLLFAQPRDY